MKELKSGKTLEKPENIKLSNENLEALIKFFEILIQIDETC